MTQKRYETFKEFYPFYLSEHSNKVCRLMHFIGTTLVLAILIYGVATEQYKLLWFLPVAGYGFAWIGHFVFEKNRPASFKQPFYSFIGDWVMYAQIWLGKVKIF
ncbi:MAG: hypothetical protein COW01_08230 [Bdellovibrionales bacterium CG12_big_fil_rev_8_21_14_0_65_38_15]|nr:MAG: hypothetical protein COW79_04715 [Bdellovibrionales bacterium CG22_combo_CG10-13_8_21_14_all_38_13]PIQ55182.1 MAG: hypothetical protein COW01_08230 [Bdellovibrionales bacterium CG12_big_fil_rev_8_21_14_0_65_38_15]